MHVQSCCSANLSPLLFAVLVASPSSLLKLPNKSSLFTSVNILYCFILVRLIVQALVVPPVHLQQHNKITPLSQTMV